jgi:hypothetical protein
LRMMNCGALGSDSQGLGLATILGSKIGPDRVR